MENPETCVFFKPSALAPWICNRWLRPGTGPRAAQFKPFCSADLECEGEGRKVAPDARLVENVAKLDHEVEDD